jgi:hypothetical protein
MTDIAQAEELRNALARFTGTEKYYRIYPKVVLTNGTKFLADAAGCYWLMDLYASHLVAIDPEVESFTCLKLIKRGLGADIVIDDGNTHKLAKQHIEYTDFPLDTFVFYAVWAGKFWVLMLTSEY